jgi:hypothetical protein
VLPAPSIEVDQEAEAKGTTLERVVDFVSVGSLPRTTKGPSWMRRGLEATQMAEPFS